MTLHFDLNSAISLQYEERVSLTTHDSLYESLSFDLELSFIHILLIIIKVDVTNPGMVNKIILP